MELNANMDKEYYNAVKELLNYDIDDVKTMVEIGILTKKMSKNFKKGTENEKISLNEKVMYETEVESLKKENEKLQKRYYSMREEMRDEFYEKQQKSNDKFQEMVRYYQEELNNSKLSNNEIVNATIREKPTKNSRAITWVGPKRLIAIHEDSLIIKEGVLIH